ncbi:MAG: hypothetical protein ABW202_11495 [Duganella sp.]
MHPFSPLFFLPLRATLAAAALLTTIAIAPAYGAAFYDGKPLAHPVVKRSQDSGADIAFIKEAGGVAGYYCACQDGDGKQRQLDQFGKAEVRSVFYAPLDRNPEVETLLVLLRRDGKPAVRAYRYYAPANDYRYLKDLQPALDRIAQAGNAVNASQIKAALSQLAPLDYSVSRGKSGNPDFDAIDHTAGTLVGYYDLQGKPVAANSKSAMTYKKTFRQQGRRFLTASYTQDSDVAGELPNYRLWQVTWESAPQEFSGSEHGPAVIYSRAIGDGSVIERGEYVNGQRHGLWQRKGMREGEARGKYVNGLQEGPWHFADARSEEDGEYRAGQRQGRWTMITFNGEEQVTSFDTYQNDQLHGPHESRVNGVVRTRGNFVNSQQQGPWITEDGEGAYVDGLRNGPWKLIRKDSDTTTTINVNYVKGKKHGEATERDASGALRLREHYQMDVLEGERIRYAASGAVVYTATMRQGQLHGRERAYDDSGKILRMDTQWNMGKKQGLDARYYPNGKPERLAEIDRQLVTHLRVYAENGQLIDDIRRCYFTEAGSERNDVCDVHRGYNTDGSLNYDVLFQFGARQEGREWYPNGKLKRQLLVDREADTSVLTTYHDNGQLQCTEPRSGHRKRTVNGQALLDYSDGKRDGERICYHPNGKVASIRVYKKGPPVDCGKEFDASGKQTFPGPEGCPPPKKYHFNFSE